MEEIPREGADYDARVLRHFLTGSELSRAELGALIERALELKADRLGSRALAGRSVALVFNRPSTRTRFSFEIGVHELGGHAVLVRDGELQLARGESVRDTATVLSRYVAAIGIRTGPHALVDELARHAGVPVVNMLTESHHPCQALADLLTLRERFGKLEGLKLGYVGDGNNVVNSLMILGAAAGLEVVVATPPSLAPDAAVARSANAASGSVTLTDDPSLAADGASALYTDVWVSMGDDDAATRRELLSPYQLGAPLLARARADAVVLHCLPAHPGEEITAEVLYGDRSAVWDQAENRLHAQKALLELICGG
ncbi:MAG: ornithine carbamoyltransferase [Thermoleophilaceae bacterium]